MQCYGWKRSSKIDEPQGNGGNAVVFKINATAFPAKMYLQARVYVGCCSRGKKEQEWALNCRVFIFRTPGQWGECCGSVCFFANFHSLGWTAQSSLSTDFLLRCLKYVSLNWQAPCPPVNFFPSRPTSTAYDMQRVGRGEQKSIHNGTEAIWQGLHAPSIRTLTSLWWSAYTQKPLSVPHSAPPTANAGFRLGYDMKVSTKWNMVQKELEKLRIYLFVQLYSEFIHRIQNLFRTMTKHWNSHCVWVPRFRRWGWPFQRPVVIQIAYLIEIPHCFALEVATYSLSQKWKVYEITRRSKKKRPTNTPRPWWNRRKQQNSGKDQNEVLVDERKRAGDKRRASTTIFIGTLVKLGIIPVKMVSTFLTRIPIFITMS
jgi:hypothetical protein